MVRVGSEERTLATAGSARLVMANESTQGHSWNATRVKEMAGSSTVTARFLRQDLFEFRPQFRLLFVSNDQPTLRGPDSSMKTRLRICFL